MSQEERPYTIPTTELVPPRRAVIGIDGNCGFALLGPNLQEGEAEFVEVSNAPVTDPHKAQRWAATQALRALEHRLGRTLNYRLDASHPDYLP